jgi:hypothetical protein
MPALDGRGLLGQRPMTGGAKGFCAIRINGAITYNDMQKPMDHFVNRPHYFVCSRRTTGFLTKILWVDLEREAEEKEIKYFERRYEKCQEETERDLPEWDQ